MFWRIVIVVLFAGFVISCDGGQDATLQEDEINSPSKPLPSGNGSKKLIFSEAEKLMSFELNQLPRQMAALSPESMRNLGFTSSVMTEVENSNMTGSYRLNVWQFALDGALLLNTLNLNIFDKKILGPVQPSPDEKKFVLQTADNIVFILNSSAQPIFYRPDSFDPVWLDNDQVVIGLKNGLALLNASNAQVNRIGPSDLDPKRLAVSPDKSRIAFIQNNELWLIHVDGSKLTQITLPSPGIDWPTWMDRDTILIVKSACPPSGPLPEVIAVNANQPKQDISSSKSLRRSDGMALQACGPIYWVN